MTSIMDQPPAATKPPSVWPIIGVIVALCVGIFVGYQWRQYELMLVFGSAFAGASDPSTDENQEATIPSEETTDAPRQWVKVASWTGTGTKSTEKFTVGDEWKISWMAKPSSVGAGNFAIMIYDGTGGMVGLAANLIGASTDESYRHQAGTYYLEIQALEPYAVSVWENR